ncbi:MAG: ZIP family metal transporter [Methanomassiliicoccus sp.]|nr:ZIP family metal transporter [Methanomassiliicoccus sp.]
MDSLMLLLIFSALIVLVSLLGGSLPLLGRWSSVQLHLMAALSAGVFIGATFLILLPEAVDSMDASRALMLVMLGFVIILLIEVILQHRHREDCDEHTTDHQHILTSTTAFVGLSVHSAMDGFALGVAVVLGGDLGSIVFLAILAHKAIDVFSLTTTFRLAEIKRRTGVMYMVLFSLITPVAALVAFPLIDWLQTIEVGVPLALAGGTFMYVGIYDLLPEAFHEEHDQYKAFALVVVGIVLMYILDAALQASGI